MRTIMFTGQGSQRKGMGEELFPVYKNLIHKASEMVGYDLQELCVKDPDKQLGQTQFTQPALYVVNALRYYEGQHTGTPDYCIGHSLGEYNALLAAGAFDFETGLRLVQKRGELMAAASGGGMAAVLGVDAETLRQKLTDNGYTQIDIANYNTPTQVVVAGPQHAIQQMVQTFDAQGIRVVPLFVSAPFHSRFMQSAAEQFAAFLQPFSFFTLQVPVISNFTARPYENHTLKELLSKQIAGSVRWVDSIRYLMGKGVTTFEEIGGEILTKMVTEIRQTCLPLVDTTTESPVHPPVQLPHVGSVSVPDTEGTSLATQLGNADFRNAYGLRYAYLTGSMYQGISSSEWVIRVGKAGMLGFLGTSGMPLHDIETAIVAIRKALAGKGAYGLNLTHHMHDPDEELKQIDLYLRHQVPVIEAALFMTITPALVYYRLKGLRQDENGQIRSETHIIAKVSRPEVAELFMKPAPERLVHTLLQEGRISPEQAQWAARIPMSQAICVEADSGWYTEARNPLVMLSSIRQTRNRIHAQYGYTSPLYIGTAGGLGTPEALASAFVMGSDFVLTGSINQCTVEAAIPDTIKDLLQDIDVQDTAYAPGEELFTIGAKTQVLKKGILFPVRANKLYALYNQYESVEALPVAVSEQLAQSYFQKPLAEVWNDIRADYLRHGKEAELAKAEQHPHYKMALVFRHYFVLASQRTQTGNRQWKENFLIHTGPALGAFNQWVKGTPLEKWQNRHVDTIAIKLLEETALLLKTQCEVYTNVSGLQTSPFEKPAMPSTQSVPLSAHTKHAYVSNITPS